MEKLPGRKNEMFELRAGRGGDKIPVLWALKNKHPFEIRGESRLVGQVEEV
jgi:hypothetical protein